MLAKAPRHHMQVCKDTNIKMSEIILSKLSPAPNTPIASSKRPRVNTKGMNLFLEKFVNVSLPNSIFLKSKYYICSVKMNLWLLFTF